jgi:hypothetical protein
MRMEWRIVLSPGNRRWGAGRMVYETFSVTLQDWVSA